jgi:hypothetical protein
MSAVAGDPNATPKFDLALMQKNFLVASARYGKMVEAGSAKLPAKVSPYALKAAPIIGYIIAAIIVAIPLIIDGVQVARKWLRLVPETLRYGLLGFFLCFFGGVFPATIAAIEAWRQFGGDDALHNLETIGQQLSNLQEADAADNLKDDDGDGIPDVDQIDAQTLTKRKASLALQTIDPVTVNNAISGLSMGWIAVLATLKIKFAKVATLGASLGDMLYTATSHTVEPMAKKAVPEEYHKWISVVFKNCCKAVAINAAWFLQRWISAFHSAIRGGLMFGRSIVKFLDEKGIWKVSHKDTYADEIIAYSVAAIGLLFQISRLFSLPFPLNILLLPFRIVEGFVVWSIMS